MKISRLFNSLILVLGIFSQSAFAVSINMSQRIEFGRLVFVSGSCDMDWNTGNLTNLGFKEICSENAGRRGLFQIQATANTVVTVNVHSHKNDGDNVEFIPSGQLSSTAGNVAIVPNTPVTINSGVSGQIDLVLGGRLIFLNNVVPNTHYLKDFTIEFFE